MGVIWGKSPHYEPKRANVEDAPDEIDFAPDNSLTI